MSDCAELLREALAAGHVVSRAAGEHLEVRSYAGHPLSAELRCRLLNSKAELLCYLVRRERAAEMVATTFGRLADAYPTGCSTGSSSWRLAEATVDRAYEDACQTGSFDALLAALADYEQFAMSWFVEHARQQ